VASAVRGRWARQGRVCVAGRRGVAAGSAREGGDLDRVVAEHAPAAPDAGADEAADAGPAPAVLTFERGDPALGTGAPFDELDEVVGGFYRLACLARLALTQDGNEVDAELVEVVIDR